MISKTRAIACEEKINDVLYRYFVSINLIIAELFSFPSTLIKCGGGGVLSDALMCEVIHACMYEEEQKLWQKLI